MKKVVTTVLVLLTSFSVFSDQLNNLKGSIATLATNVGDMEVSMTKNTEGNWVLKSHLDGGRLVQRKEEEIFKMDGNDIKPISYYFKQRIFLKKLKSSALFDWKNKNVAYKEAGQEGLVSLMEGTLGPSTAQLQLRFDFKKLDLENLPEEMIYNVFWKGKIKKRVYKIIGKENTKTPMGEFLTYKVERIFSKGSERAQIFWLAPELDFAVIRILNIDGRETDIKIKTFKILD